MGSIPHWGTKIPCAGEQLSPSTPQRICASQREMLSAAAKTWRGQVYHKFISYKKRTVPGGPLGKNPPADRGDMGSTPGLGSHMRRSNRVHGPHLLHPRAATPEAHAPRARNKGSQLREKLCTATNSRPRLLQPEKAHVQPRRPSTVENKLIKLKKKKIPLQDLSLRLPALPHPPMGLHTSKPALGEDCFRWGLRPYIQ